MPQIHYLRVSDLKLDLRNYRIPPTSNELESVHALSTIRSHYFWDLTRSLVEDGYDGTENIIVLRSGGEDVVREGNRRIGAMKIIHGLLPRGKFDIPNDLNVAIDSVSATWRTDNDRVPCLVYTENDRDAVDRLVQRTHGRGETAGRLKWEPIARARYNRDVNGRAEPALNLLEAYLRDATKISDEQREEWGGEFPITILYEAMQKVAVRYQLAGAADVLTEMEGNPNLAKSLGKIVYDVATGKLETRHLRPPTWGSEYGLPSIPAAQASTNSLPSASAQGLVTGSKQGAVVVQLQSSSAVGKAKGAAGSRKMLSLDDPRSVKRELRRFAPRGNSSSKIVTLLEEAKKLNVASTPICFCFVLRSMFDLSASAYCSKHRLPTFKTTKNGTKEKSLAELLGDASKHLQANSQDRATISALRTAGTEITSSQSVLSIPVMNQLVHSGTATITEAHVVSGFHKVFPLLVELNR